MLLLRLAKKCHNRIICNNNNITHYAHEVVHGLLPE